MEDESDMDNARTEKMNMADRFITAMFVPKEYGRLLRLKSGSVAAFIFCVVLLATLIQYAIPTLGAIAGMGGMKQIFTERLPEFEWKDGMFTLSEKVERQDAESGIYFVIDTDVEEYTKEDIPANAVEAVMISKSNALLYQYVSGIGQVVQDEKFEDYKELQLNNRTLAALTPVFYLLLFIAFIVLLVVSLIKYLMTALFYALVMYLLSKTMTMDLTYGQMYRIALFAQVFGTIVMAVTYCIGQTTLILTGSAFYMLVTIILMNKAMVAIKAEQSAL